MPVYFTFIKPFYLFNVFINVFSSTFLSSPSDVYACPPGEPKNTRPHCKYCSVCPVFSFSLLASERGNFIHSDEIMSGCKKFKAEYCWGSFCNCCRFSKVRFNLTLIWPFHWQPVMKTPANKGHFQRFRALLFASSLKIIFQSKTSFISSMIPSWQNP